MERQLQIKLSIVVVVSLLLMSFGFPSKLDKVDHTYSVTININNVRKAVQMTKAKVIDV